MLVCCLVSFCFLWAILCPQAVLVRVRKTTLTSPFWVVQLNPSPDRLRLIVRCPHLVFPTSPWKIVRAVNPISAGDNFEIHSPKGGEGWTWRQSGGAVVAKKRSSQSYGFIIETLTFMYLNFAKSDFASKNWLFCFDFWMGENEDTHFIPFHHSHFQEVTKEWNEAPEKASLPEASLCRERTVS